MSSSNNIVRLELTEEQARDVHDILDHADRLDGPEWERSGELCTIVAEAIDGNRGSAFTWYQEFTEETAVYPDDHIVGPSGTDVDTGLLYTALGLNGEAGEVAEKIKKDIRGDDEEPLDIGDELGDVLWYLARLCDELDYDFDSVARRNASKLTDRKERDVLKGSGDER